jgi:hypothetical protein
LPLNAPSLPGSSSHTALQRWRRRPTSFTSRSRPTRPWWWSAPSGQPVRSAVTPA